MLTTLFARRSIAVIILILTSACQSAASAGVAADAAADGTWHSAWTTTTPAPLDSATFFDDAEVVLSATRNADLQLTRLDGDGARRWSAVLHGTSDTGSVLDAADGGAYSNAAAGYLTRVSGDGSVVWQRHAVATAMAALPGERVATFGAQAFDAEGRSELRVLDGISGDTLWIQTDLAASAGLGQALATDALGNVYTLLPGQADFSLVRRDGDGNAGWRRTCPGSAASLQLAGDKLYVTGANGLSVYRSNDGAPLWSTPEVPAELVFFADDPVLRQAGQLRRLDADSGSARWLASIPGLGVALGQHVIASIDGTLVITLGGATPAITRVDGISGVVLGSTPLPMFATPTAISPDRQNTGSNAPTLGDPLASKAMAPTLPEALLADLSPSTTLPTTGKLGNARGAVIGQSCSAGRCRPVIVRFAPDSGELLGSSATPSIARGITGQSGSDGARGLIDAGLIDAQLYLRRVSDDGTVAWDITDQGAWDETVGLGATTTSGNRVVVALTAATGVWISAYDRSSGQRLWQTMTTQDPMTSADQGQIQVRALLANGAGDVVLVTTLVSRCCMAALAQSVIKLSGSDGTTQWRRGSRMAPLASDATAYVISGDVFAFGAFETIPAPSTLVRLSGLDGSTVWRSSSYDATTAVITGDGNLAIFDHGDFIKIDARDGSQLWRESSATDCAGNCYVFSALQQLPNGDFIQGGGRDDSYGEDADLPWLVLQYGDGSGARSGNPFAATSVHGDVTQVLAGIDGRTWLRFNQQSRSFHGIGWLSQLDPVTLAVSGNQALSLHRPADTLIGTGTFSLMANPAPERLLLSGSESLPDLGTRSIDRLIDSSIVAHGDLVASLASSTAPEQGLSHVTISASYHGDAPVDGISLVAPLPVPLAGMPVCLIDGSIPCSSDAPSGNVHAEFDLRPGATATVSFDLQVNQDTSTQPLEAILYGPPGLSESDIGNNIAYGQVLQSSRCRGQHFIRNGAVLLPGRPVCDSHPLF